MILLSIAMAEPLGAAKKCECGSHVIGITTFNVTSGGCCDGVAADFGQVITYHHEGGDVWSVASVTTISGTAAQNHCCPKI